MEEFEKSNEEARASERVDRELWLAAKRSNDRPGLNAKADPDRWLLLLSRLAGMWTKEARCHVWQARMGGDAAPHMMVGSRGHFRMGGWAVPLHGVALHARGTAVGPCRFMVGRPEPCGPPHQVPGIVRGQRAPSVCPSKPCRLLPLYHHQDRQVRPDT